MDQWFSSGTNVARWVVFCFVVASLYALISGLVRSRQGAIVIESPPPVPMAYITLSPEPASTYPEKRARQMQPVPRSTLVPRPTALPSTPSPPPAPTLNPILQAKHEFLASVDESISGALIAGNPYKYVGQNVDLHCTVASIPDPEWFNATCGADENGWPANIVVKYQDTSSLDKGQSVRVMGTVEEPMEGTNLMGGQTTFPTVQAQYME